MSEYPTFWEELKFHMYLSTPSGFIKTLNDESQWKAETSIAAKLWILATCAIEFIIFIALALGLISLTIMLI